MSVKDVVESQIQNARTCRNRYMTMSEVDWLVGGIVFSLKHSMSVISDPAQFSQAACTYVEELSNAGQHEAASKVSAWVDQLPPRHDLFAA